jgi:hypothetical protein
LFLGRAERFWRGHGGFGEGRAGFGEGTEVLGKAGLVLGRAPLLCGRQGWLWGEHRGFGEGTASAVPPRVNRYAGLLAPEGAGWFEGALPLSLRFLGETGRGLSILSEG